MIINGPDGLNAKTPDNFTETIQCTYSKVMTFVSYVEWNEKRGHVFVPFKASANQAYGENKIVYFKCYEPQHSLIEITNYYDNLSYCECYFIAFK